jgi:hypothetical protein
MFPMALHLKNGVVGLLIQLDESKAKGHQVTFAGVLEKIGFSRKSVNNSV